MVDINFLVFREKFRKKYSPILIFVFWYTLEIYK